MSDAQSLTLPEPGSLSRARRRSWRRPPNWKWIIFWIVLDLALGIVSTVAFVVTDSIFFLVATVMFGIDLTLQVRRLFREDGGYRWYGEDRGHMALVTGIEVFLLLHWAVGLF